MVSYSKNSLKKEFEDGSTVGEAKVLVKSEAKDQEK